MAIYQFSLSQIKWSLRRLLPGIKKESLVIEIGSGGNPTPKSDLLVEPHLQGEHKKSKKPIVDRPTLAMSAENLPVKDKAFDYCVCFHVLEHVENPEIFLNELNRISKGGYIETPTPINEVLFPYKFHLSTVENKNDELEIRGLSNLEYEIQDRISEMVRSFTSDKRFLKFYRRNPNLFNTTYYWNGDLKFNLRGDPKTLMDFGNYVLPEHPHHETGYSIKQKLSVIARRLFRALYRTRFDVLSVLECKNCTQDLEEVELDNEVFYKCSSCDFKLQREGNLIFIPS